MARIRPTLFVGSSSEGLKIAKAVQVLLDQSCEVMIWSQGVFGLSEGTLESLVGSLDDFDFAALVLTPEKLDTHQTGSATKRDFVEQNLKSWTPITPKKLDTRNEKLDTHQNLDEKLDTHQNWKVTKPDFVKPPSQGTGRELDTHQPQ